LVVELNSKNFDQVVAQDKYIVVKFYTRWCGYCRLMAPEYDKLFEHYKDTRQDLLVARLEGSINEDISYRYRIFSFPMVVLFHPKDKAIKSVFEQKRTMENMSAWIERIAPPLINEPKMLGKSVINENNLDENLIIVKADKPEVTDEIEFVKREILSLKNKIDTLEKEFMELKNITNNDKLDRDFDTNSFTVPIPSLMEIIILVGCLIVLLASILTIKRIFFKRGSVTMESSHAKI
jgi:thiol-disulfide isomerase/thioredoxin